MPALARRALAELIGTGLLVAVVVGSGIMAARLSPGDTGLELLENTLATVAGLAVLIVVSVPGLIAAQAVGGVIGLVLVALFYPATRFGGGEEPVPARETATAGAEGR